MANPVTSFCNTGSPGCATAANQLIEIARLTTIACAVEDCRVKVNPIVGEIGIQGGAGPVTDNTIRVALASDVPLSVVFGPNPGVDIGDVTVNNGPGGNAVNIQDGGNSITVDGTVTVAGPITATVIGPIAVTQSGPWSVEVNNAGGAAAVNIQDGGNSITVDGTVTVIPSGTQNINVAQYGGAVTTLGQKVMAASVPVVIASDQSPIPISGTITVTPSGTQDVDLIKVGGVSIVLGQTLMADSFPVVISSDQSPIPVTQSGTWVLGANSGVDIGDVTVNNGAGAAAVNIQDGGNSITVDGAVTVSGTVAATQSGTWILGANSGVDIGDVTINNAGGAAAVNIQDGGNSITVDGTVTVTPSGTQDVNVTQYGGVATTLGQKLMASSIPVVLASNQSAIPVSQSGSWTVAATQSGTWILGANSGVDIGDVTINNASGASAVNIQDGGNSITVDGAVTVSGTVAATQSGTWNIASITSSVVPGTGATNLGKAEDAGHTSGDTGVFALAVRNDSFASFTNANLDYSPIAVTSAGAVNIHDGGNSITVDGTVAISGTVAVTQSGTWILGANSGVDIGDVTINNASGASAVNIQDGGNSITVDGTVTITPSGTQNINVSQYGGVATTLGQKVMTSSIPVVLASDQSTLPVSGNVTVDLTKVGGSGLNLGQQLMNDSVPVVIASDQSPIPISGTVVVTPSGTQDINLTQYRSEAVSIRNPVNTGGAAILIDLLTIASSTTTSITTTASALYGTQVRVGDIISLTFSERVFARISVVVGTSAPYTFTVDEAFPTAPVAGNTFEVRRYTPIPILATNTVPVSVQQFGQQLMASSFPVVIASNQSAIPVTLASITTSVTPGTGATNLGKAEDAQHLTGDTGVFALAVRNDSFITFTTSNLDYSPIAVTNTGAVQIHDGGNSITVDGTVSISGVVTVAVSGTVTVTGTVAATQSGTWILGANSGVDIGDVTINNASGASAVNIQDGGNSITVDGTVTATPAALSGLDTSAATVGTSSSTIIATGTRKDLTFVNTSSNTISLAFNTPAVLNSGVTLIGRGSSYILTGPYTGDVRAIASAAGSNLSFQTFN